MCVCVVIMYRHSVLALILILFSRTTYLRLRRACFNFGMPRIYNINVVAERVVLCERRIDFESLVAVPTNSLYVLSVRSDVLS